MSSSLEKWFVRTNEGSFDGQSLVVTATACGGTQAAVAPPTARSATVPDSMYVCGRVAGTEQKSEVDSRGQKRTATAAFITAAVAPLEL